MTLLFAAGESSHLVRLSGIDLVIIAFYFGPGFKN